MCYDGLQHTAIQLKDETLACFKWLKQNVQSFESACMQGLSPQRRLTKSSAFELTPLQLEPNLFL